MAAWYNGLQSNIFDITQYKYNTDMMLRDLWANLIYNNAGRVCYFHNWGGYDAILSLGSLLNLPPGYTFNPIVHHGEVMSITVLKQNKIVLTIKDSIRILPGALAKLAKDWKVKTQKDHFPHYFLLDSIEETLYYSGPIPEYEYFDPGRRHLGRPRPRGRRAQTDF
jgi:hypothetical protein